MTPPTATSEREVAGLEGPTFGATIGYLVVLAALTIALAYPTLAGAAVAGFLALAAAFFLGTKA